MKPFGGKKDSWERDSWFTNSTSPYFMKRCWGIASDFLHVICLCMSAHPPLVPAVRAGRQAGEVGGRATLFLSLSRACWQLLGEAWGPASYCRAEPQPHPGRFRAELMYAHGHGPTTNWRNLKSRQGLDKRSPNVYSIRSLVLIFEESLCGCTGLGRETWHTSTPFKGLKSILTEGCFLSGHRLRLARSAWPTGCHGMSSGAAPRSLNKCNRLFLELHGGKFEKRCIFGNHRNLKIA